MSIIHLMLLKVPRGLSVLDEIRWSVVRLRRVSPNKISVTLVDVLNTTAVTDVPFLPNELII